METHKKRLYALVFKLEPLLVEWHNALDLNLNLLFALENQQSQLFDSQILSVVSDPTQIEHLAFGAFRDFPELLLLKLTQNQERIVEKIGKARVDLEGKMQGLRALRKEAQKISEQVTGPTLWTELTERKEAEPSIAEMLEWIEYLTNAYDLETTEKITLLKSINVNDLDRTRELTKIFPINRLVNVDAEREIFDRLAAAKKFQDQQGSK